MPAGKPRLIVFGGLPGAGKSYLARALVGDGRLGPADLIEADAVRRVLFPEPTFRATENRQLYAALHDLVVLGLDAGHSVVVDATNLRAEHRAGYAAAAAAHGARYYLIWVFTTEAVALARLAERIGTDPRPTHGPGLYKAREHMQATMQRPESALLVDGTRDVAGLVDGILQYVGR